MLTVFVTKSKLARTARHTTGNKSMSSSGQGIATLFGKPADGEDGGLVSQKAILAGFGCSFCLFIYLLYFIFGCVGSSFLCEGFLQLRRAEATPHRGARASHCRGLSLCGAQAPDAQAQWLWLTGLVAPRHVGSSQTRARTYVPCIGRQILNHCATREAPWVQFLL